MDERRVPFKWKKGRPAATVREASGRNGVGYQHHPHPESNLGHIGSIISRFTPLVTSTRAQQPAVCFAPRSQRCSVDLSVEICCSMWGSLRAAKYELRDRCPFHSFNPEQRRRRQIRVVRFRRQRVQCQFLKSERKRPSRSESRRGRPTERASRSASLFGQEICGTAQGQMTTNALFRPATKGQPLDARYRPTRFKDSPVNPYVAGDRGRVTD